MYRKECMLEAQLSHAKKSGLTSSRTGSGSEYKNEKNQSQENKRVCCWGLKPGFIALRESNRVDQKR